MDNVSVDKDGVLFMGFGFAGFISIVPEFNGLESCVLSTSLGVYPVLVF